MPFKAHVMGSGVSAGAAGAIIGGVTTTVVGAGTDHTNFTLLPFTSVIWVVAAANNSGVGLPPGNGSGDSMQPGDYMDIFNADANTLLLYPPSGGSLNNGTVTTGTVSIATHTGVRAISIDGLKFIVGGPNT